jgi:transposase
MVQRIAVGWDLHRKFSQVSVLEMNEAQIKVVRRQRLEHADRAAMAAWLAELPPGTPVAMEGAFGWQWVADLLGEMGLAPHLGHPPALRALAKHEPKSDRVDADRLARFWLQAKFPACYLAPPEVRQIRERVRYRTALSGVRMQLKCRIQAILHRQGILHEFSDLFGKRGRAFLKQLTLPPATRVVLDGWLALLDDVLARLAEVEAWMRQNLAEDEIVRLLQTIPGIGLILAHVIRAEVGQLDERFHHRRKFTSYAGLAPLADDSADRHGRRHISPTCNHVLRWAFIEAAAAALHARACPRKLRRLHQRLTHGGRVRKQEARVAVARELCELVYIIWKTGEPYREPPLPEASAR